MYTPRIGLPIPTAALAEELVRKSAMYRVARARHTHDPIVCKASCARTCFHLVRLVVGMDLGASTSPTGASSPQ
jgi:hypothetical protein